MRHHEDVRAEELRTAGACRSTEVENEEDGALGGGWSRASRWGQGRGRREQRPELHELENMAKTNGSKMVTRHMF
jgi:hypothetical protein